MNPGNNEPREAQTPGGRVSGAVAARPTLPQATDIPREGLSARPLVLITRGRVEFTAKCPGCDNWHRHRKLGDVQGPCGTFYELQPRRGRSRGK
jgi:hypothetical protein